MSEDWSFLRGKDKTHGHASEKYDSLSKFFVDTITNKYNQDISFLLVGRKGSGKSYTSLSLAYQCATQLAERVGGTYTDYFNPDENLATIDPNEANRLMANMKKYQVKIYDDIGIGWGARNWQDEENKAKNDVIQISRISRQIQIYSVPTAFLLDKVPRSLVSHYGETYQQFFKMGYVAIKVFEPQILHRMGKIIQPHLVANRSKYVIYTIPTPPKELSDVYDRIRMETTMRIAAERMDEINKGDRPKVSAAEIKLQEDLTRYGDRICGLKNEGKSDYQIGKILGMSKDKVSRLAANYFPSGERGTSALIDTT